MTDKELLDSLAVVVGGALRTPDADQMQTHDAAKRVVMEARARVLAERMARDHEQ